MAALLKPNYPLGPRSLGPVARPLSRVAPPPARGWWRSLTPSERASLVWVTVIAGYCLFRMI